MQQPLEDDIKEIFVRKIQVFDLSPDLVDTKDRIKSELRICSRPEFIEPFFTRLEGWWLNRVITQLSLPLGSLQSISQQELFSHIHDLNEEFHQDNLPIDFLSELSINEKDIPHSRKLFIEQLKLIFAQNPRIQIAIRDYYRAYSQRSRWLREELLLSNELDTFESKLFDEWSRTFERLKEEITSKTTDPEKIQKGREIYDWMNESCKVHIRPRCTEEYVTRGSFHMLADELKVGWHPDFYERLEHLLIKGD